MLKFIPYNHIYNGSGQHLVFSLIYTHILDSPRGRAAAAEGSVPHAQGKYFWDHDELLMSYNHILDLVNSLYSNHITWNCLVFLKHGILRCFPWSSIKTFHGSMHSC
jgi:hypothetical protein